jgi:hypothetical protein
VNIVISMCFHLFNTSFYQYSINWHIGYERKVARNRNSSFFTCHKLAEHLWNEDFLEHLWKSPTCVSTGIHCETWMHHWLLRMQHSQSWECLCPESLQKHIPEWWAACTPDIATNNEFKLCSGILISALTMCFMNTQIMNFCDNAVERLMSLYWFV